jgi:hypothetical protein
VLPPPPLQAESITAAVPITAQIAIQVVWRRTRCIVRSYRSLSASQRRFGSED